MDIGFGELVVVGFVALVLFGGRLPEVMRTLGRTYRGFRKGVEGLTRETTKVFDVRSALNAPYRPTPVPPTASLPSAATATAGPAAAAVAIEAIAPPAVSRPETTASDSRPASRYDDDPPNV